MAVIARQYPNLDGLGLPLALTRAIHDAYQRLYDLRDKIFSSTGTTVSGGSVQTVDVNPMTASTPQPFTLPSTITSRLSYVIQQDSAGSHAISFDSNFVAVASGVDTSANTIATFEFSWSQARAKYVMMGQPSSGMTP